MNKLQLLFFYNIVSLTFLTWISHRGNQVGTHNIYLNINYLKDNTYKVRNDRLLTNNDPKSEIGQSDQSDNVTIPGEKNNLKDITGSTEIHERVKMDTENSMHAYIKKLERGYTNKKGLKRFDCHYEKKLFNEMYKLDEIAGHMKSKNSYFKKLILKRYGLRFVVFLIVILFGITASIVCYVSEQTVTGNKCKTQHSSPCDTCKFLEKYVIPSNSIIYVPIIIAFLSFIIYLFTKVRKYKRLKNKFSKTTAQ